MEEQKKKESSGDRKRRKTDREICNSGNYQYADAAGIVAIGFALKELRAMDEIA